MLQINQLDVSIKDESLLKAVSASFSNKTFNVIIGENGVGKSQFLKKIYSLKATQEGQLIIDGLSIDSMTPKQLDNMKQSIGVVSQSTTLFNYLTLEENIGYRLLLLGKKKKDVRKKSLEIALHLGIDDVLTSFPNEVSGGQLQRAAIAMNAINQPTYLFLDESTSNLDFANSIKVIDLCQKLQNKGTTIFFITHDIKLVDHFKQLEVAFYQVINKGLIRL